MPRLQLLVTAIIILMIGIEMIRCQDDDDDDGEENNDNGKDYELRDDYGHVIGRIPRRRPNQSKRYSASSSSSDIEDDELDEDDDDDSDSIFDDGDPSPSRVDDVDVSENRTREKTRKFPDVFSKPTTTTTTATTETPTTTEKAWTVVHGQEGPQSLMVKVYRGPTKTIEHKPFASWGYFVKFPSSDNDQEQPNKQY